MTQPLDERTLQRCVDGELNEAEQQALLSLLDRSLTGWRELALAFIEQQLWTQAGQAYVQEPPPPQAVTQSPEPQVAPDRSWLRNTVMVATTLIAVGLGYIGGSRSFWSGGTNRSTASTTTSKPSPMQHTEVALANTH